MPRFIDANVFLYAFLKPRRKLREHEVLLKNGAKSIIYRVNSGEEVVTTVVHLGEIANILEEYTPLDHAIKIIETILLKKNIVIVPIEWSDYLVSIEIARKYCVGINDALAYSIMKRHGINEVYSFDRDFDKFPDIKRITR